MNLRAFLIAACVSLAVCAAHAQTQPPADPPAMEQPPAPASAIRAGAAVQIELVDALSSAANRRGESFAIRLAEPVSVNGAVVAPAGGVGRGEIIDASPSDSGGKPGVLVLAVRYLELNGARIPLRGLTRAISGESRVDAAHTASVFVSPLFALMEGKDIAIPAGTRFEAFVADASATPGNGTIVFFRPRRNSAGVYKYGVREGETQIARLPNGAYTTHEVPAGIHEYSVSGTFFGSAPSDTLRIEVETGQTYYIEHAIQFLIPSDRAAFEARPLRQTTPDGQVQR
jgi:hypothetical protein